MQYCPRCGEDVYQGDRWCRSCGQDLRDDIGNDDTDGGFNWECDGCGLEYSKRPKVCPDCMTEAFTAVEDTPSTVTTTAPTPDPDSDDTDWSAVVAASEKRDFDWGDVLQYGSLLLVVGLSAYIFFRFV